MYDNFYTLQDVRLCIVCTHLLSAGGLNLLPNLQKGGAWQDLNFDRGVAGKEGGNFFQGGGGGGGLQFYKKII